MKKTCIFAVALILAAAFSLASCDNPANGNTKKDTGQIEGPQVSGDFTAAPELTFAPGTIEGTIQYSWTAAVPADGVTYTLFVTKGSVPKTDDIVKNGTAEKTGTGPGSGIFTGKKGELYSAVVQASKGSSTASSAVMQATAATVSSYIPPVYDLRFGVISDSHVGATSRGSAVYPTYQRLEKALDWYNTQADVKAVAIVGDITDGGTAAQWSTVKDSLDAHLGALRLIAVMGNHDAYPTDKNNAADLFELATGQKTNAHYVIDGYHFIVLNAGKGAFTDQGTAGGAVATGRTATPGDNANNGDVVPQSVKDWVREQVDTAKAASPGKPIFVFLHWPLQNTFYVSDEWYASSFGSNNDNYFFKNDPEVVIFGGHIHSPNNDPRSIWQGGFTSVNTAALHYFEMEKAGTTAKYLGDSPDGITTRTYPKHPVPRNAATATGSDIGAYTSGPAAQGMIVSVQGTKVTIENYDFDVSEGPTPLSNVAKIPQTWQFDVAQPASFPYTKALRDTQKTKPVFDASATGTAISGKIRAKDITDTSLTVNFDQARMPAINPGGEVVHSYRFDFIKKGSTMVERSVYQWSDFMNTPRLQKPAYTQLIGGLTASTEYELRIYAYSSFQERSEQYLTVGFTTAAPRPPVEYDLKFQGNLNNTLSRPASVSVTGTAAYDTGVKSTEKAIKLDGDNYIQLDTAADPFNYNQSFTIAFWIKVLSFKGSDPVVFSNKNWAAGTNNGFLFAVKNSGSDIRLNCKAVDGSRLGSGSNDLTVASGVMNQWVHIAVVFDKGAGSNGQVRYYKNGVKVGEESTNLTSGIGGGQRSYLGQSDTGGTLYNGSSKSYNAEFLMQNFLLKSGALSDSAIQALAAQ